MDEMTTTTAGDVLDRARRGSAQLLLALNAKTVNFTQALNEGRFGAAVALASEISQMAQPLAVAELRLAPFADTYLARADEVEVGMEIRDLGEVKEREVETEPCPSGGHDHTTITFKFDGGAEITIAPTDELLVVRHDTETG